MDSALSSYTGQFYNILSQLPFNTIDQKLNLLIDDHHYELTEVDYFMFYNRIATYQLLWHNNKYIKNQLIERIYNLIHRVGSNKGMENVKFFNVLVPDLDAALPLNVEYSISELANTISMYKNELHSVQSIIDMCQTKDIIIEEKNIEIARITNTPVHLNLLQIVTNVTNKIKQLYNNLELPYTQERLDDLAKYADILNYKQYLSEKDTLIIQIDQLNAELKESKNASLSFISQITQLNEEVAHVRSQLGRITADYDENQTQLESTAKEMLMAQTKLDQTTHEKLELYKKLKNIEDSTIVDLITHDKLSGILNEDEVKNDIISLFNNIVLDISLHNVIETDNSISQDGVGIYNIMPRLKKNIENFMIKTKLYLSHLDTRRNDIENKYIKLEDTNQKNKQLSVIRKAETITLLESMFTGISTNISSLVNRSQNTLNDTYGINSHNKTVIDDIHNIALDTRTQMLSLYINLKDYFIDNDIEVKVALTNTIQKAHDKYEQLNIEYQQQIVKMKILQVDITDAKGIIQQLKTRLLKCENLYDNIQEENNLMREEIKKIRMENHKLTNEQADNIIEMERIQQEYDDKTTRLKLNKQTHEIASKKELTKKNIEIEELNATIYEMRDIQANINESLESCKQRYLELLHDKIKLDNENAELKADLENKGYTISNLRRGLDQFTNRLSVYDNDVEDDGKIGYI